MVAFRGIDELFLRGNRDDSLGVFVLLWIFREDVDVPTFCLVIWSSMTLNDWAESEGYLAVSMLICTSMLNFNLQLQPGV